MTSAQPWTLEEAKQVVAKHLAPPIVWLTTFDVLQKCVDIAAGAGKEQLAVEWVRAIREASLREIATGRLGREHAVALAKRALDVKASMETLATTDIGDDS